jgi:putative transcriptional regulator
MRKRDFANLVESIRQAGSIRRGTAPAGRVTEFAAVDVKAIRRGLGKSQSQFARMIGVSVSTLQNWEQGRRQPVGPARALLRIAAASPEVVSAALS